MRANSTQINKRLMRSQRFIFLTVFTCFIVILVITGLAGHHNLAIKNPEFYYNVKSKVSEYYSATSNHFSDDLDQQTMENKANEIEVKEQEIEKEKVEAQQKAKELEKQNQAKAQGKQEVKDAES